MVQSAHVNRIAGMSAACICLSVLSSCEGVSELQAAPCSSETAMQSRTINVSPGSIDIVEQLGTKEIVFTLDDGPHAWRTPKVLDTLDHHCVKATFFLQGNNAERHPKLVREIAARGHTVGSHTYTHQNLKNLELDAAMIEVQRGRDAVSAAFQDSASGSPSSLFRFPFVASTPELDAAVESSGLIIVPVNADGADWTRNSAEESTELVLQKLTDQGEKGIVLLHDPFSKSDRRVDHLIRALSDRDYTIVHVVQTPKN